MIKDLHKECVCASCEHLQRAGNEFWISRLCKLHNEHVFLYCLCPDYKSCELWKQDPSPPTLDRGW